MVVATDRLEILREAALRQPGAHRRASGMIKFQCPACAAEGHDRHQDNAAFFPVPPAGTWGCAWAKDSAAGRAHWEAIGRALGAFDPTTQKRSSSAGPGNAAKSQADLLIRLAEDAGVEPFHTSLDEAFLGIPVDGHKEAWPAKSKYVRHWLARRLWRHSRKAPSREALQATLDVLEGWALFEGKQEQVHLRSAWHEGALYYDLGDPGWRAVKVTGEGWEVVSCPPVRFRRYAHMAAQAEPERGGTLDALWQFVNVPGERDRRLLKRTLVVALIPDIPRPIIAFYGDSGSGKTWSAKTLATLVDPSEAPLVRARDEAEFVQGFAHHYAVVLDNLSLLSPWANDLLSRAVTGDGFTKRQLYTDEDDITFVYRRVFILTGINLVITQPDLLDRSLIISVEKLSAHTRQEERALGERFETERSRLFGALLDQMAGAIREYPHVVLRAPPRMADYARWAVAVGHGQGEPASVFIQDFSQNVEHQNEEAINSSTTATVLLGFLKDRDHWEGTIHELLGDLQVKAEEMNIPKKQVPGTPQLLGRRLREIRPNLAAFGWEIVFSKSHHPRTVSISRSQKGRPSDDPYVPTGPFPQNQSDQEDRPRDNTRTGAAEGASGTPDEARSNPASSKDWDEEDNGDNDFSSQSGETEEGVL